VRNAASGSTHLLGALAGKVLLAMIEAPASLTLGELAARLGNDSSTVQDVLTEFERLGLAERMD
jgi:DNA-binding IclR family transcriptional regulator